MSKKCPKCGTVNTDASFWCENCNAILLDETTTDEKKPIEHKVLAIEENEMLSKTEDEEDIYNQQDGIFWTASFELNKKNIIGILAIIIILVFVSAALILPWYNLSGNISGTLTMAEFYGGVQIGNTINADMYLNLYLSSTEIGGSTKSTFSGLNRINYGPLSFIYTDENNLKEPMETITYLNIIVIVLTIITAIMFFALLFKKVGKKIVFLLFTILTIFILITLVYCTLSIPNALNENVTGANQGIYGYYQDVNGFLEHYDGKFIGSINSDTPWTDLLYYGSYASSGIANIEISWGPSFGWVMILLAVILASFCCFLVLTWKNDKN